MTRSPRILVVDGDARARAFVDEALGHVGMVVEGVADGPEALEQLATHHFDAVVLEVELRSMSGLTLLRRIRERFDVAAVVLSACDHPMFSVVALESGADDYCAKPVPERELVLRVEMALERRVLRVPVAPSVIAAHDGLVVDPYTRLVAIDGIDVDLTAKEFDLLVVLASSPGKVFTRGELLEIVWQAKPDWQSVDTVTEHIYRLRQKLDVGHERPDWIQTVRGAGYRFAPSAATTVTAEPAAATRDLAG